MFKTFLTLFCLSGLVILGSGAARAALTAEQESYLQKAQTYLDDASLSYAAYPVDMCGHAIPTKIDPSLVGPFLAADLEVKNYCEEIRTKVALICRDNTGPLQARAKNEVKSISCKLSAKPSEISFQFVNGDLQASFGTKASDIDRAVMKYLETGWKTAPATAPPTKKSLKK